MFLADKIIKYKKIVLLSFLALAVVSLLLLPWVKINYSLADYLPANAPSTLALKVLEEEYSQAVPNARVYIPDITIPEALSYKEKLADIQGVENVLWLDDIINIYEPLEMSDSETVEEWYKDGGAVFTLTVRTENTVEIVDKLRETAGSEGAVAGLIVDQAAAQTAALEEVKRTFIFFLPVIVIILLLAGNSWFEPVLFLLTIGVSVVINMGLNILHGEISFVTQVVSPVLQLAVSMDYAIFLLKRFFQYRIEGLVPEQAMQQAMIKAAPAVIASAMTTVFGFLALALMKFRIGPDMGLVLAKGIFFSLLSVMVFLPVLTLYTYKIIDKTRYRPIMPSFANFSRFVARLGIPFIVCIVLIVIPSYLAQKNNSFIYGTASLDGSSGRTDRDAKLIENVFGKKSQMVLLVPRDNPVKEKQLVQELSALPQIISLVSYTNTVGELIPVEFLNNEEQKNFFSANYSRIIITADTAEEGDAAFSFVETVREKTEKYFEEYHLAGGSVNIYDIKETVTADNTVVNCVAILAIGMVLLLTFRSLLLPFILLLTIEAAIWINLAVPYFTGSTLNYVGYLIISSVQLGATVDYGILLTQHYLDNRRELADSKEAARKTVSETASSILTPAVVLVFAGIILYTVSTNSIVRELGLVLGRGAALSAALVLLFLPNLLTLTDKLIGKTTLGLKFKKRLE